MSPIIDVLIVDDDPDWQIRMKELLQDKFSNRCVSSEHEAMEIIKQQYFHCAIVDKSLIPYNGEDEGGMRILEELKNLGLGTKRLMLTSYGSIDSAVKALTDWDASIYFEKKHLQGSGSQEVMNKIQEMVSDARVEYNKRFGSGIEQLIAGFTPRERAVWESNALMALSVPSKHVDYKLLKETLDLLLEGLSPLIAYDINFPAKIEKENAFIEGKYWSKGLGMSISIKVGEKIYR